MTWHTVADMDPDTLSAISALIGGNYASQANVALAHRYKLLRNLVKQPQMPEHGWPNSDIEWLLNHLSAMDSNNFPSILASLTAEMCGLGEREGRIINSLVQQRHYG